MILDCGNRTLDLSTPVVMGILNVTPDSFSDGGKFNSLDNAIKQAEKMLADGAKIIDVGGESTRPGASEVGLEEELNRVVPVVEAITTRLDVCVSVDSSAPEVMTHAADAGAHLLNDVRGFERLGAIEAAIASRLPICIMHMQGQPQSMQTNPSYEGVVSEVLGYLASRAKACCAAGVPKEKIILDPGFGFGKTVEHNYQLLANMAKLTDLGYPVLAGLSRKSMLGAVLASEDGVPRPVSERLFASVSSAVIAAMGGAHILRVHDVKATADALAVVSATLQNK